MKASELRELFRKNLLNYSVEERDVLFFQTLDFYAEISKINFLLNQNQEIKSDKKDKILLCLNQLTQNFPIQYIIGETSFFGLSFFVTPDVLIPRQETEELVDLIIQSVDKTKKISILDIGTGSGCIAISLAKSLPNAKIFALDISEKALNIAKKNAEKNQVSISFIRDNILEINDLHQKFDCIVSNPPYVRELEKTKIRANVLLHEPHLALFVPNENPLIFYEKIASIGKKNLHKNGKIFFEINQYLGKEMEFLMKKEKYNKISLKKDLSGNYRILTAQI